MKKLKVLAGLLVLSFILNVFFTMSFFNAQAERVELEKAIIMNEFSERTKELRNFMHFASRLSERSVDHFPIREEESTLYWELANPNQSVVMNVTDKVNAEYPSYPAHTAFFMSFDREYQSIINRMNTKLPLMSKTQLGTLSDQIEEIYDLFVKEAIGPWSVGTSTFEIDFEPSTGKLDQVIRKLISTREWLEDIE